MLRALVLALVAAAAVATTITSYEAGHDYLYRYEVITSSALRAANHQTAGLKIRTDVRIQVSANKLFTLRFENPELCKVHQEVPAAETVETVFEHSCTPVTGEEATAINQELTKPFVAQYWENGMPTELRVESDEKYWSVNIKRGFLNLLKLNLKEENAIDPLFHLTDELRQRLVSASPSRPVNQLDALFRSYEEDMVGDCESIYSVHEDEHDHSKFFVNKVRNYDNCLSKPMLRNGLLANFVDVYPELEETSALKTLSHADYELEGDRQAYIVKSAYLTNHFSLRPVEDVESAYTCTRQNLKLVAVATPMESTISLPSNMEVVPIFKFFMPLDISTTTEAIPEFVFTDEAIVYYIAEVKNTLQEVVATTPEELDASISGKIIGIAKILDNLPLTHFKKVVNQFMSAAETDELMLKKREILLDILPTLTRPDTIPYITELFKQNVIKAPRAVLMINMATLTVTPSPRVFEHLKALLEEPRVVEYPMFKKSVLFNLGAIANKIRNLYVEMNVTDTIVVPEMHKIKESLVHLLTETHEPRERMHIITMFGNSGLLELYPTIEELIKEPTTPGYLRSKAIFALRKMCNIIPLEVQRLLLPIYADDTLEPHIRVSAFLMVMKTNPSFGVMQTLTHELKKETNVEVLSFVCSYLKVIVASEDPHMRNMTSTIKTALENVHMVNGGLLNSGIYSFEKFMENAGPIGADIKLTLFNNGLTPSPDSAIVHLRTALFGKKFDLGQMGIMTSGLKDLFWNMYGPENRFKDFLAGTASFEDILRPFTDLVSKLVSSVDNINNKFTTSERTMVTEKMVELYAKVFDYELFSVNYNADEMVELWNKVKDYMPELFNTLRSEYPLRFTRTIALPKAAPLMLPTPAGIPVFFDVSTAAHMHFTGKVQLQGVSSLTALFQVFSGNMPDFTLTAEFEPHTVASTVVKMGSYIPFFSSYAAVRVDAINRFSAKTMVTVMPTEKKVKFTFEPVTTGPEGFLKVKVTPMTLFKQWPMRPAPGNKPNIDIMTVNTVPTIEWETEVYGQGIGLPIQFRCEYPSVINVLKPHTYFVSPMWAEFNFFPHHETADKFEFEMKYYAPGEEPKSVVAGQQTSWSVSNFFRSAPHDITGFHFDAVEPEGDISVETARHLIFTVRKINGETSEKEIKLRFTHMYDVETYLKQQFNLQILSSPIRTDSTTPMKLVFNTILYVPEFFTKFIDAAPVFTEPELWSKAELKFGFVNKVERLAFIKNFWKRELTDTTSNRMLEATTPYTFTKHIPQMFRNVSALQGIVNSTLLHKMFHEIPTNMPLVFTSEVEYTPENVPEFVEHVMPTIHEFVTRVPAFFSDKATVMILPAWNEEDHFNFTTVLDPFLATITHSLELPTQSRTIYGIPLPMPYLFKKMIHTPAFPLLRSELMDGDIPAGYCSVTPNNYIHTFDMLSTKLPNEQCEIVLTKDCSALNIFMVTMKPTDTGKKIITVYLPGKKVEIIPATDNTFTVKINDEVIQLPTDNTPYIVQEQATGTELLRFIAKSDKVFVYSWKYGLTVETNGISAFVKPSDLYRGQLCGACSDFQASLRDELRGPHKEMYNTPQEFLSSYTIRTPGCEAPLVAPECESIQRNVVFERFVDGRQAICISVKPINQCSGSCTPRDPRQISQAFDCRPADQPAARALRDQAMRGPLSDLTVEHGDHKEIVTEFQTCAPAH